MKYLLNDTNKNNFIFCIVASTNDVENLIRRYENIILKSIIKYGKFIIFNFKKKNKKNLKLKIKNCKIVEIENSEQFNNYIKNKTLFAIDEIGRRLAFFSIRKLLNKKNINLILIMDIGFIPNTASYKNKKISFQNKIYNLRRFLERYFCRFLILLNIYPKTQFYFESNIKIVNKYKKNTLRNFILKFPLLDFLLNFKIIENINSKTFEYFKKYRLRKAKSRILFIDGNYKHGDVLEREGKVVNQNKKKYLNSLRNYLQYLKKIFKKDIYICLHPSSNFNDYKKLFPSFKINKGNTREQIYNSSIVVFHESSAVIDAFISKKKIISFQTELLGEYYSNRINLYISNCDLYSIHIDKPIKNFRLSKNEILKKLNYKNAKMNNYIKQNILSDRQKIPSEKILNEISKFIYKNEKKSLV